MRTIPLPADTVALTGFTHKSIIEYTDLTAAAGASDTTVTIQILPETSTATNPAGLAVLRCGFNLITAFDASDSSINSLLMEVGDGGDPNRFLGQTQVAVDGTEILFEASAVTTFPYAYTAADGIDVKFTVAGGGDPTIDELTSGKVEIYLAVVDLNALENVKG